MENKKNMAVQNDTADKKSCGNGLKDALYRHEHDKFSIMSFRIVLIPVVLFDQKIRSGGRTAG